MSSFRLETAVLGRITPAFRYHDPQSAATSPDAASNDSCLVVSSSSNSGPGISARLVAQFPLGDELNCNGMRLADTGMTTEFMLPSSGSVFCGRDHKTCQIWIPDIHCSRRHAELIVDQRLARVCIVRLGSNPTKVVRGDQSITLNRFTMFDLQDGDLIVFPKDHSFQIFIEQEMQTYIGR